MKDINLEKEKEKNPSISAKELYINHAIKELVDFTPLIKFEVSHLPNIHFYKEESESGYLHQELQQINLQMGIEVIQITDLEKYQPPKFEEIIISRYLICTI